MSKVKGPFYAKRIGVIDHYKHMSFGEIVVYDVLLAKQMRKGTLKSVAPISAREIADEILVCARATVRKALNRLLLHRFIEPHDKGWKIINDEGTAPVEHHWDSDRGRAGRKKIYPVNNLPEANNLLCPVNNLPKTENNLPKRVNNLPENPANPNSQQALTPPTEVTEDYRRRSQKGAASPQAPKKPKKRNKTPNADGVFFTRGSSVQDSFLAGDGLEKVVTRLRSDYLDEFGKPWCEAVLKKLEAKLFRNIALERGLSAQGNLGKFALGYFDTEAARKREWTAE